MKNFKNTYLTIFLFVTSCFAITAQTNVSGGIYANTTWTLANSPYIVTANVVLFPSYTLTIQPGVVVKFDNGTQLEIRQAALVALGTSTDSITFTGNTSTTAGSWNSIYLNGGTMTTKFSYCNFKYATNAISDQRGGVGDTLMVNHSNFNVNTNGIYGQGTFYGMIDSCNFRYNGSGTSSNYGGAINHCDFSYNQTGFDCDAYNVFTYCTFNHNNTGINNLMNSKVNYCTINNNQSGITFAANGGVRIKNCVVDSNAVIGIDMEGNNDSIYNCQMQYNGIGLRHIIAPLSWTNSISFNKIEYNNTGFVLSISSIDLIHCNKICNNSTYDLMYTGMNSVDVSNNYWCTSDSTSTEAVIYDGYDNTNYGLVNFMPLDTQCYLTTGMRTYESQDFSFNIFPNPNNGIFTLNLKNISPGEKIEVYNSMGEIVSTKNILSDNTTIDISNEASGIYFYRIISKDGMIASGKIVTQ